MRITEDGKVHMREDVGGTSADADVPPADAGPSARARPPLPYVTSDSEPFWASCAAGRMELQHCKSCGQWWFPPSNLCPNCWSFDWAWEPVAGTAAIVSFVTFQRLYHKAFEDLLPYSVVCVELDEGPRMLSRLVGVDDPEQLEIGAAVQFRYQPLTEDVTLPLVEPAGR